MRPLSRIPRRVACFMLVCGALVAATLPASGASNSATVVSATVPTATSIDTTACSIAATAATSFGTVLPGSGYVTASDCRVSFGSSNGTANLRVRQTDGAGAAMWGPSSGVADAGFGASGVARVQTVPGTGVDHPHAAVSQPGGRTLIAGVCGSSPRRWCITRLDLAGVVDTSFGSSGVATVTIGSGGGSSAAARMALDPVGRILVAGTCVGAGHDFCVTRLSADGQLDTEYGVGGSFIGEPPAVGGAGNFAYALAVRADGSVLVAGDCNLGPWRGCVVALDVNGRLDTSFGTGGWSSFLNPATSDDQTMYAISVLRSGAILVAGECYSPTPPYQACAARLTSAGAVDTTFGSAGWQTFDLGQAGNGRDVFTSIIEDAAGRVVLGGSCTDIAGLTVDACAVRLLANGQVDGTFGSAGSVVLPVGPQHDFMSSMLAVPGGYVLGGFCTSAHPVGDPCAVKIGPSGSVVTSFGTGGAVVAAVPNGQAFSIGGSRPYTDMVGGVDGALLIVSSCSTTLPAEPDMCAVRLDDGSDIADYGSAGASWTTGETSFGACLRATTANPAWTTTGTCTSSDPVPWRGVSQSDTTIASASSLGQTGRTADLRFGLNLAASTPPGSYIAPITFSVVAA